MPHAAVAAARHPPKPLPSAERRPAEASGKQSRDFLRFPRSKRPGALRDPTRDAFPERGKRDRRGPPATAQLKILRQTPSAGLAVTSCGAIQFRRRRNQFLTPGPDSRRRDLQHPRPGGATGIAVAVRTRGSVSARAAHRRRSRSGGIRQQPAVADRSGLLRLAAPSPRRWRRRRTSRAGRCRSQASSTTTCSPRLATIFARFGVWTLRHCARVGHRLHARSTGKGAGSSRS